LKSQLRDKLFQLHKIVFMTIFIVFFVAGEIPINKHNVQSLLSAANLLEVLHVRELTLPFLAKTSSCELFLFY
jgi:hypothetical protein